MFATLIKYFVKITEEQVIFDFEKIELLLYEKNEYKILHDCIDFIKACKLNF